MPIIEYECKKCTKRMERIEKFSDAPLVLCPLCEKGKLKKVISKSSFQLKGTGWHATDYLSTKPKRNK